MTASDLLLVAQAPLQFRLKRLLHLPTIPELLLDVPWHRVVVNQVPLIFEEETAVSKDALLDVAKKSMDALKDNLPGCARETHPLVSPEDELDKFVTNGSMSVCIAVNNAATARRMVRDGMYIFSQFCRVSFYKPRRKSATRSP